MEYVRKGIVDLEMLRDKLQAKSTVVNILRIPRLLGKAREIRG
jgi:hypothetical protein